jgi:aryl-alcohol dehydrogenase-like predicted oxidoreductase
VPIPGTKRVAYLEENVASAELELTPDDLAALEAITVREPRAPDENWINRTTPAPA